jgi:hypothetical protein
LKSDFLVHNPEVKTSIHVFDHTKWRGNRPSSDCTARLVLFLCTPKRNLQNFKCNFSQCSLKKFWSIGIFPFLNREGAGKRLSHKFVFQNNNLECVSRYKYLGIWFNNSGSFNFAQNELYQKVGIFPFLNREVNGLK